MLHVVVDFETRSKCDLKKHGLSRYARHSSTRALMLAYNGPGIDGQWVYDVWVDADTMGVPPDLLAAINDPSVEFHAHNAPFEIYIWRHVMVARLGWPELPGYRWRCTAAKAAHANQPRSLGNVGKRLGLAEDEGKTKSGKSLIRNLSIPKKLTKKKLKATPDVEVFEHKARDSFWEDDQDLYAEFRDYNRQDVTAEMAVDERLPSWPEAELGVWRLDRQINERGIPVDLDVCRGAIRIHAAGVERINARLAWITDGAVTAYSQVAKMSGWVNERVNFGSSLAEGLVEEYLAVAKDAPPDVIEVLNLRLEGASAAVKKYVAAVNLADADDRIRESTKYYGAATGRWSGAGIQPHNMKRSKTPDESYYQAIATGDYDLCALLWDNPIDLLKKSVRGIICAPPGRKLVVSDFANIEARVLAWLAGQESMLKTFRASQDVYIASACEIFGYPPADIADWDGHKWKIKAKHSINGVKCSDMRQLGKGCVLGLGYGMGAAKFAANVRIQQGLDLDPEFVEGVVKAWRTTNSAITRLWANLNNACIRAIQSKGQGFRVGKLLAYWHKRGYLCIRLPSGRDLFYYQAKLGPPNQWGNPEIMYLDGSKGNAKNAWTKTYGGKLVENVTQAVSRDPLVHSMQLIDRGGFDLVLHVHDESVSEVDAGDQDAKPFIHNAMQTLPPWAEGLPLEAETYESRRYTK